MKTIPVLALVHHLRVVVEHLWPVVVPADDHDLEVLLAQMVLSVHHQQSSQQSSRQELRGYYFVLMVLGVHRDGTYGSALAPNNLWQGFFVFD